MFQAPIFHLIIILQTVSNEFKTGSCWGANDLVRMAEFILELEKEFQAWKLNFELRAFEVNLAKNKGFGRKGRMPSGKYLCSVCCKGVGINSIHCV